MVLVGGFHFLYYGVNKRIRFLETISLQGLVQAESSYQQWKGVEKKTANSRNRTKLVCF